MEQASVATTTRPITGVKRVLNHQIRRAIGLTQDPPPRCDDPDLAYTPVDGVARLVHGDLASMLVGGIASLFFQMLHPSAMAGVAQHSRYQDDPFGRMLQTANFIGFTTYGTSATAYAAIERVLAVHESVRGVTDDGTPYYANDPHLLLWVHCAEISMFLAGYERFGHDPLQPGEADRYVAEMATLARDLGIPDPPTTVAALRATLAGFRGELRLSEDARRARDWLAKGVIRDLAKRPVFWLIVRSAYDLMPSWAREVLGVRDTPRRHRLLIRPLTALLSRAIRVVVPPTTRVTLPPRA